MTSSLSVIGIEDDVFIGRSPGFGGIIKRRPCDFLVNEIDVSGRQVEASSSEIPPPPATPPSPSLAPTPSVVSAPAPAPAPAATSTQTSASTPTSTSTSALAVMPLLPCAGAAVSLAAGAGASGFVAATGGSDNGGGSDHGGVGSRGGSVRSAASGAAAAQQNEAGVADSSRGGGDGDDGEEESNDGWLRQLRRCLGGSESELARLAKFDAAARGPGTRTAAAAAGATTTTTGPAADTGGPPPLAEVGATSAAKSREAVKPAADGPCSDATEGFGGSTAVGGTVEAEGGGVDMAVRIPAGQGADKAERARVHRAVQETFPFIKTATERAPDGAVTVVCTQAAPLPALLELLSGPEMEALQRMVNRGPGGIGAESGVTLSSNQDRANRTLVHRAIAEAFPYLQTKTRTNPKEPKSQRVSIFWSKRRGGGGSGGGKKRKREGSDSKGGIVPSGGGGGRRRGNGGGVDGSQHRWVRFGLRKDGCEHHRTALALSKALRVPLSAFSFGGIKDKTAITTQACVVKGVPPGKILETNGTIPGVTIGNLVYCDRGLSLGELSGNKFSIVVRGAKAAGRDVESSLQEVLLGGFVNFFGTQRVGSPSAAARGQPLPCQIGRDILSGDWGGAVAKILAARDNDPPFLRSALEDLLGGKITPKECAARVRGGNRLSVERSVIQGLVRYGASAFQAAIQCVPFSMRTMWVHAYQSLVWNSLACARLRLLGPEAVPGDLVLLPDQKTPPDVGAGDASASTCSSSSGGTGDIAAAPRLIPVVVNNRSSSAAGGGVPRQGATGAPGGAAAEGGRTMSTSGAAVVVNGRRREAVGVLTSEMMEAFASEGITPRELLLRRVVLPLAGTSILYPLHEVGDMYRQHLERDGAHSSMWPEPCPDPAKAVIAANAPTASPPPGDGPAPPPRPSEDHRSQPSDRDMVQPIAAAAAAAKSGGLPSSPCSECGKQGRGDSGIGDEDEDGDGGKGNAPAAAAASNTTAGASVLTSSGLVPRGAYRRLVCMPADASWEAATPWGDDDDAGGGAARENLTGSGSSASSLTDEKTNGFAAASGGGAAPVAGSVGDSGGRHIPGDSGAQAGRAGKKGGKLSAFLEDVRLVFTLPPGSFATMFLREVMKRNDDIVWQGPGGKEGGEGTGAVEADGK